MNNVDTNTSINVGIILKLEKAHAYVMTDKLEFVELKRTEDMTRGQKVFFDETDLYVPESIIKNKSLVKTFSVVASAAAVFLVIFYSLGLNFFTKNYTYVSVDINPSLELSVDRKNVVAESKPLNSDARLLLEKAVVEKLPVKDALKNILDVSKEEGFLDDANNTVLFSVSPESKGSVKVDEILTSLKEVTEIEGLHSEVIQTTPDDRKIASDYGLSMGKYAVYTKANEKGLNITIEEIKNSRVSQIFDMLKSVDPDFFNSNTGVHVAQASPTIPPVAETTPPVKVADASNVPSSAPTPSAASSSVKTPAAPSAVPSVGSSMSVPPTAANKPDVSDVPVISTMPESTPGPSPTRNSAITVIFTPKATPTPKQTTIVAVAPTPNPTSTPWYQPTPKRTRSTTDKTPKRTSTPLPIATPVPTTAPTAAPVFSTSTPTPLPTVAPVSSPTHTHTHSPTSTPTSVPTPVPTHTPIATPTSSPTRTPTHSPTATPTPIPTVTPTKTPPATSAPTVQPTSEDAIGEIKLLMYNENTTPVNLFIQPRIKLVNTGSTTIKIKDIKVRYYFTIDEVKYPIFDPDWLAIDNTGIDKSNIKCKFVKMSKSTDTADYYAELSFADIGDLKPGMHLTTVFRIRPDHTKESTWFDQLSDYSFNNSAISPSDWNKVTVYISGKLVSGIEP